MENTNIPITADFIESAIKVNYIFNNLLLTSKLQVIKASSKSNMAIMWMNIWDIQSRYKAKSWLTNALI